jgi:hypothetical protein
LVNNQYSNSPASFPEIGTKKAKILSEDTEISVKIYATDCVVLSNELSGKYLFYAFISL